MKNTTPITPLEIRDLPPAPPLRALLGPSFIILGLGLGSGEVILWPYLVSNHGLGIVWAIVVGVVLQFFLNMEIERYALINGESIFVGFARLHRLLPYWFILSTLLGFSWPGIGLAGSTVLAQINPAISIQGLAIASFIGIGLILTLGKVLYQTVETIQKILILAGTPIILLLTFSLTTPEHLTELAKGLIGIGNTYSFIPKDISIASFLAALVYSGAGGNLNLSQSFYIRDKGYGMGAFAQKIKSLLTSNPGSIKLTGTTFNPTAKNLTIYKQWWHRINIEHALIFVVTGLITMLTLALLAHTTVHGLPGNKESIDFVIREASIISDRTLPILGTVFLTIAGITLTATQLTVLDSTSRIITENLLLTKVKTKKVSLVYYTVLWAQILIGIAIISFASKQPRELIVLSAVLNSLSMAVYSLLLVRTNTKLLPNPLQPNFLRKTIVVVASIVYGTLFVITIRSVF